MNKTRLDESLAAVGAIVGLVAATIFALTDPAPESFGELLIVAAVGGVLGALLFGSIGNWIYVWRKEGFRRVLYRTIGFVLGVVIGYGVALFVEWGDPTIERGRWTATGSFLGVMFAFFGLWMGALVDRIRKGAAAVVHPSSEEDWTKEEMAGVSRRVRSMFARIEEDEYEQPGVFLITQMKEAENPFVRARAIRLLAKKRPGNLMNIASEGLSDQDARVRRTAARALGTSSDLSAFTGLPTFKTILLSAKDDEDEIVRTWIAKCITQI